MKNDILHPPTNEAYPTGDASYSAPEQPENGGCSTSIVKINNSQTKANAGAARPGKPGKKPISCKWGLSSDELTIYTEAMHWLRRKGPGLFVTYRGDESRALKSDIAKLMRRRNMRPVFIEVRESKPALHSHIFVVMNTAADRDWLAERLYASRHSYPQNSGHSIDCRAIYDWAGLSAYPLKESSPQAHFWAGHSFTRKRGSHPIDGGDRVRLSDALRKALISAGHISEYARTYRKRTKPTKRRPAIPLGQQYELPLAAVRPSVPVLRLVEDERKYLGLPQHAVAALLGIKQPAYANIIRGHDKPSVWVINRALEFVADRLRRAA